MGFYVAFLHLHHLCDTKIKFSYNVNVNEERNVHYVQHISGSKYRESGEEFEHFTELHRNVHDYNSNMALTASVFTSNGNKITDVASAQLQSNVFFIH